MSHKIVTLKRNGFELEFSTDSLVSLTKLWKMAGSPKDKRPSKWKRINQTQALIKEISKELNVPEEHIYPKSSRGRDSESFAHYKLVIEYAGYIDIKFKSWCLEQIGRLIAEPEILAADILIANHNKDRVDRAKKRILVCETNKQTAEIAYQAGAHIGKVHNDRYNGLYRKTAALLRKDAGIGKNQTPLNVMSSRDLKMNDLANTLALEAKDPDLLFDFANDIRESYQKRIGKELRPKWEEKLLRPSQARSIAYSSDNQLELPL